MNFGKSSVATMSILRALPVSRFFWLLAWVGVAAGADETQVTPADLKAIEAKLLDVVKTALPATVCLTPGAPAKEFGSGSGVIVSEDGLILTAAHVTMKMNDKVTVTFPDGKKVSGKVLGMDYTRDSGMVQITDKGKYPYVPVGESANLKENDWCVALGHSGGFDKERTPPVRLGRVIDHDPKAFLMTDSALIGGDSGGPLFDIEGRLIGIHSNIGFSLSQNNHVPIGTFHENWERLKKGERYGGQEEGGFLANPERPMIGAEFDDAPEGKGALIREVFLGSPAAKAGIKAGDTILKVGDTAIGNREAFVSEIGKRKPGDELKLTIQSPDAKQDKTVTVKLIAARLFRKSQGQAGPPKPVEPDAPADKKTQIAAFEKKLRDAIESGELKLTPDDIGIFENPKEFQAFMDTFKKSLKPEELEALNAAARPTTGRQTEKKAVVAEAPDPDQPAQVSDLFIRNVLNAFRPSVARASESTHPVFRGSEWKSLCTVVHSDGYAVTKASEIDTKNNQALTVMLAKDRKVPAEIVKTFPKHDLALLKLKSSAGLPAIAWGSSGGKLALGSLISAAGSGPDAVAIGVVSVLPRSLAADAGGFLGIGTASHEKGVQVNQVLPGGAAAKAGIKKGDIILRIDGAAMDKPEALIAKVKAADPGTEVVLEYLRGETETSVKVKLGDRSAAKGDPNARQNRMGTELSEKRTGYQQALQTDLPIRPEECGGPVVDLDGNVIAMTIARAGRTVTYALLAEDVRQVIDPELRKLTEGKPMPVAAASGH